MSELANTLATAPEKRVKRLSEIRAHLEASGVPWTPGAMREVLTQAQAKGVEVQIDTPESFGGDFGERVGAAFTGSAKGGVNSLETEFAALVNKAGLDDDHSMMRASIDRGQRIQEENYIPDRNFFDDVVGAAGSSLPMAGAGLGVGLLTGNPVAALLASAAVESGMEQGGSIQEIMAETAPDQFDARADNILGETSGVFAKNMLINTALAGVGGSVAKIAGGKSALGMITGGRAGAKAEMAFDTVTEMGQEFAQSLVSQKQAQASLGREISMRDAAYEGLVAAPVGLLGGGASSAWTSMVKKSHEIAADNFAKRVKEQYSEKVDEAKVKAKDASEKARNKLTEIRNHERVKAASERSAEALSTVGEKLKSTANRARGISVYDVAESSGETAARAGELAKVLKSRLPHIPADKRAEAKTLIKKLAGLQASAKVLHERAKLAVSDTRLGSIVTAEGFSSAEKASILGVQAIRFIKSLPSKSPSLEAMRELRRLAKLAEEERISAEEVLSDGDVEINPYSMIDQAETQDEVNAIVDEFAGSELEFGNEISLLNYALAKKKALRESAEEHPGNTPDAPTPGSVGGSPGGQPVSAASALEDANENMAPVQSMKPDPSSLGNSRSVDEELGHQSVAAQKRETGEEIC